MKNKNEMPRSIKTPSPLPEKPENSTESTALIKEEYSRRIYRFALHLFPRHSRLAWSEMQLKLLEIYQRLLSQTSGQLPDRPPRRLAIAAPRGAAKSTLKSLILPIHSLLYQRERYIILISATMKQARQRLRNLKSELLRNEQLGSVYSEELSRRDGWTTAGINVNGVQIDAFSAGTEIRGISYREWRPTLVILDDVEDEATVYSSDQREKLLNWYNETIENIGDSYTAIEVIGTLLHPDSLLSNLLRRPDFESYRFPSILQFSEHPELWDQWRQLYTCLEDEQRQKTARSFYLCNKPLMDQGAKVLWPAKESYYQLQTQLTLQGRRAFFKEKQNEPTLVGEVFFDLQRATKFRRTGDTIEIIPGNANLGRYSERPIGASGFPGSAEPQLGASKFVVPTSQGLSQSKAGGKPIQPPSAFPIPKTLKSNIPLLGERGRGEGASLANYHTPTKTSPAPQNPSPNSSLIIPLSSLRVAGFLDTALGKQGKGGIAGGDYASIVTVGIDKAGYLYVLDVWLQRVPPSIQVNQIFNLHNLWNYALFGIESNCFQALLSHPIEEERARRKSCSLPWQLPIRPVNHSQNKELRIATLEPLISNGWLRLDAALPERFYQQLESFPNCEHDDALDALEGAVSIVRSFTMGPITQGKKRKSYEKFRHF